MTAQVIPVRNKGTCTDRVNGFNCSCAPVFNGTQCETGNRSQINVFSFIFRVFRSLVHCSLIFHANKWGRTAEN